jgi:hypothetical protein
MYELGDKFGTYRSAGPSAKTFRGTTPIFKPHTQADNYVQEVEEDLWIVGLFQHVANYSRKME